MKKLKRQLVLNKGAEKFIFRYENKLTQSLIGQADEILGENTDAQIHAN